MIYKLSRNDKVKSISDLACRRDSTNWRETVPGGLMGIDHVQAEFINSVDRTPQSINRFTLHSIHLKPSRNWYKILRQ